MKDIKIDGSVSGGNVNVGGSQTFNGPVYFGAVGIVEPAPKRENRIFLSYARKDDPNDYADEDKSFMRKLYRDLTAEGFDVWWDQVKMPARGLTFLQEIRDAITPCRMLVLVVGENAVVSDYVKAEWEYALSRCIPVVPILRNGDYKLLPEELADINATDFNDDGQYTTKIELLKRILQDPDAPLGTLYGVPALPGSYIEREALATVRAKLLVDTHQPLVVSSAKQQTTAVTGLGGIGKTTLASALSRDCEVRRAFPDGVFWIEIGQTPDLVTRMADIGAVFGDPREEYPDTVRGRQRLSALLRDKRALLVLDDVWEHEHAQDFRVADANCRLLITTRQSGMVTKLDAQGQPLGTLTDAEGLALIAERLSTSDKRITPEELPAECIEILHVLDGHTLAVSLAAAQLQKRGISYAANLLRRLKEGKVFGTLQLDKKDKNLNVELSLKLSYDDLKELHDELQERYRATGIFATGSSFDAAMVQAVWGDQDADETDDRVTDLVDVGLLQRDGERYTQHGLLRTYASALLAEEGETEATFGRYADLVIEQSKQFEKLPLEEWSQLDPLLPHVQEVGDELVRRWESVYSNDVDETFLKRCSEFVWNIQLYLKYRPELIEFAGYRELRGIHWLKMGLEVYKQQENQGREAMILNHIALVNATFGHEQSALSLLYTALKLYVASGEQESKITTLNNIDRVMNQVDLQVNPSYQHTLSIFRAVSDPKGEITKLDKLDKDWEHLGEKQKALEFLERAIIGFRAIGDSLGEATTLHNIGRVLDQLGEKRMALEYLEKALSLHRAINNPRGEARALNSIGTIWMSLGVISQTLDYFKQSLSLRQAAGDKLGETITLNNIAHIYFHDGDLTKAVDTFRQIILVVQSMGVMAEEATFRANLAYTMNILGQKYEALQELEQVITILKRYNPPYDASGVSVEEYETQLAQWRSEISF